MSRRERVLVAMSGGVDSSVAAALLLEAGHEVIGVTMRVWSGPPGEPRAAKSCCSLEDVDDARRVAELLGIPFYALDLKQRFQERVIDDFVAEYLAGRTPNPCLRCNTDLKFGELLTRARALGAAAVATGHYARVDQDEATGRWRLRRGRDLSKDQSYALYHLSQAQLARARFPLGESTKGETRDIARRLGLPVEAKPDSQDICFVPEGDYRDFLRRRTGERIRPGDFVDPAGRVVGRHRGVAFYTVGQRRGLGLQGEHRHFVLELRPERNQVVVGRRDQADRSEFRVGGTHWVSIPEPEGPLRCQVRVRHRSAPSPARVVLEEGGACRVHLEDPDPGISPGQACVFYDRDLVLGGGRIEGRREGGAAIPV